MADKIIYVGNLQTSPLGPIWAAVSEQGLVAVEISRDQVAINEQLIRMGYDQVVVDQDKTAAASRRSASIYPVNARHSKCRSIGRC